MTQLVGAVASAIRIAWCELAISQQITWPSVTLMCLKVILEMKDTYQGHVKDVPSSCSSSFNKYYLRPQ